VAHFSGAAFGDVGVPGSGDPALRQACAASRCIHPSVDRANTQVVGYSDSMTWLARRPSAARGMAIAQLVTMMKPVLTAALLCFANGCVHRLADSEPRAPNEAPWSFGDCRWSKQEYLALVEGELQAENSNHIEDAIAVAKRTVTNCPSDYWSMNVIAGLLGKQGKFEDEVAWARRALAVNADYALAHSNLGVALAKLGDPAGGKASLQKARVLAPRDAIPVYNLGAIEEEERNAAGALGFYEESVRLEPNLVAGHFGRGAMLATLGRLVEAQDALRLVLRLTPENASAREMLEHLEGRR
jgi:tetratricopeptide (TPR) repeat protein